MMSGVREWLAARHYSYVTNVVKDVTGYQMYFADHTGDPDTANCFINANSEKNLASYLEEHMSPSPAGEAGEAAASGEFVAPYDGNFL